MERHGSGSNEFPLLTFRVCLAAGRLSRAVTSRGSWSISKDRLDVVVSVRVSWSVGAVGGHFRIDFHCPLAHVVCLCCRELVFCPSEGVGHAFLFHMLRYVQRRVTCGLFRAKCVHVPVGQFVGVARNGVSPILLHGECGQFTLLPSRATCKRPFSLCVARSSLLSLSSVRGFLSRLVRVYSVLARSANVLLRFPVDRSIDKCLSVVVCTVGRDREHAGLVHSINGRVRLHFV